MISIAAVLTGLLLPTLSGTLLVLLLEGQSRLLLRMERVALGCVVGLALTMQLTFVMNMIFHIPFTLPLFLTVQLVALAALVILTIARKLHHQLLHHPGLPVTPEKKWLMMTLGALVTWVIAKAVVLGVVSLMLTPSFYDDTLSNWNLRGKVFYVTQQYTLVLPSDDPATSPLGVSSYPATVPLLKVWVALLNGAWTDGVVNGIHIVWYICALALVYGFMRRHTYGTWALLAVYILGSMPLYLMHGTSAYADAFLSVHIFAGLTMLFSAVRAETSDARLGFLRMGAVTMALLPLTKNEGLMVHLPSMVLLLAGTLWWMHTRGLLTRRDLMRVVCWYVVSFALIALPFLAFKWMHGLSFGNGKTVGSLSVGWQPYVLTSIFINTFFEGNWLLLFPLFFALLIWRRRAAVTSFALLTLYFLIIYLGQGALYLFTSLSTEALRQTGYARGLIQLLPVIAVLTTLLLKDALAPKMEKASDIHLSAGTPSEIGST